MEVEQLLQMLRETDDPAVRERISAEFPADPEMKGVFGRTYQNYLHAAGQERKKSGGFFRLPHAIGIAACMVLVVGVYLTMKIPHERLPSVTEETTTVTETAASETVISEAMGETHPTEPHPETAETAESVTEPASSDMGVSTDETAETIESVTEPPATEPAGSTAPSASETAVTGGTTRETQIVTTEAAIESEEASGTSVMTNPMTTAAATVRTSEPTDEAVTQTMEETVLMTTDETIAMTTDEMLLPETTSLASEEETIDTEPEMEMTECTEISTEAPTEAETTTTTTTTAVDDGTLAEYAVQVRSSLTTVTAIRC